MNKVEFLAALAASGVSKNQRDIKSTYEGIDLTGAVPGITKTGKLVYNWEGYKFFADRQLTRMNNLKVMVCKFTPKEGDGWLYLVVTE